MPWQSKRLLRIITATVTSVKKSKRSRKPAPPFTTSTLQQDGVRKLNFGAKRTMMIAQHLYEGLEIGSYGHVGLITYMRTDSTRISKDMQEQARDYIKRTYGDDYCPANRMYTVRRNPLKMRMKPFVLHLLN